MTKSGKVKALEVGQFVTLETSDYAADHGVKKGDILYVAGDGIVSVREDDPYEMRRILVCARVDDGGHLLVDEGGMTIDGLKLKGVGKVKQERLDSIKDVDFGDKSDEATD